MANGVGPGREHVARRLARGHLGPRACPHRGPLAGPRRPRGRLGAQHPLLRAFRPFGWGAVPWLWETDMWGLHGRGTRRLALSPLCSPRSADVARRALPPRWLWRSSTWARTADGGGDRRLCRPLHRQQLPSVVVGPGCRLGGPSPPGAVVEAVHGHLFPRGLLAHRPQHGGLVGHRPDPRARARDLALWRALLALRARRVRLFVPFELAFVGLGGGFWGDIRPFRCLFCASPSGGC